MRTCRTCGAVFMRNPEEMPICGWCESVIPPGKSVEEFIEQVDLYRGFGPPSVSAATKASETMEQEPVIGMHRCCGCHELYDLPEMQWVSGQLLCRECAKHGDEKSTNPKDAVGSDKLPMHLWPTTASAMGCLAMLEGALKYGRSNFRASGVRASIYYDACRRHLDAWFEGEEYAPDTGTPHLSSALACLAIIVDAQANGKLNDDRMFAETPGYRKLVDELTPHVARLKDMFKDKKPEHYTRESK